jgi:hypothetical protein
MRKKYEKLVLIRIMILWYLKKQFYFFDCDERDSEQNSGKYKVLAWGRILISAKCFILI